MYCVIRDGEGLWPPKVNVNERDFVLLSWQGCYIKSKQIKSHPSHWKRWYVCFLKRVASSWFSLFSILHIPPYSNETFCIYFAYSNSVKIRSTFCPLHIVWVHRGIAVLLKVLNNVVHTGEVLAIWCLHLKDSTSNHLFLKTFFLWFSRFSRKAEICK